MSKQSKQCACAMEAIVGEFHGRNLKLFWWHLWWHIELDHAKELLNWTSNTYLSIIMPYTNADHLLRLRYSYICHERPSLKCVHIVLH